MFERSLISYEVENTRAAALLGLLFACGTPPTEPLHPGPDASTTLDAAPEAQDSGGEARDAEAMMVDASAADAGATDAGPAPSPQEFCVAFTAALCAANQACCMVPASRYPGTQSCVAREGSLCALVLEGAALRDGRATWDGPAARQVLQSAQTAARTCQVFDLSLSPLVHGAQGAGRSCSAVNGDFSGLASCASGLACDFSGNTLQGTCVVQDGPGHPCTARGACVGGNFCDHGTCRPTKAPGESCANAAECQTGACDRHCAANYCRRVN
jgi:hypothetical protein